jgi:hypothetical protein
LAQNFLARLNQRISGLKTSTGKKQLVATTILVNSAGQVTTNLVEAAGEKGLTRSGGRGVTQAQKMASILKSSLEKMTTPSVAWLMTSGVGNVQPKFSFEPCRLLANIV